MEAGRYEQRASIATAQRRVTAATGDGDADGASGSGASGRATLGATDEQRKSLLALSGGTGACG